MAFFQDNFNGLTVLVDIEFVAKFETSVAPADEQRMRDVARWLWAICEQLT